MADTLCARCGFYSNRCVCHLIPEHRLALYNELSASGGFTLDRDGTVTTGLEWLLEFISTRGAR